MAQAILTAAAEVGCAMSHDIFLRLIGGSREGNHACLIGHYGPDYPLETLIATWGRHFRELAAAGLPLKPGALELLDLLDELRPAAGDRHVVHACARSSANLVAHGLADRFHDVVAHGDYASGKPAPDPFLKAAERLGVAPGALPGPGGFPQGRPIGIGRRHDDDHGSRPHTGDRGNPGAVHASCVDLHACTADVKAVCGLEP